MTDFNHKDTQKLNRRQYKQAGDSGDVLLIVASAVTVALVILALNFSERIVTWIQQWLH
jgi:hypothetical protein